jgi:hypothetical protein
MRLPDRNRSWIQTNAASRTAIFFKDSAKNDAFIDARRLVPIMPDITSTPNRLLQDPIMVFSLPTDTIRHDSSGRSQWGFSLRIINLDRASSN